MFVRQAMADPVLADFLDQLVGEELAPALPDLPVAAYWKTTKARFLNPMIDHQLAQIAQDGAVKLSQRLLPILQDNLRAGRPVSRLVSVVGAWATHEGRSMASVFDDVGLLPESFRGDAALRGALMDLPV